MKVALIQARQHRLNFSFRLNAPLSCAVLAGCLIRAGIDAEAADLDGLGVGENWIIPGLPEYDAIGISALSAQAEGARRLITLIRYHAPDKYIVCGGADPTLFPRKYLTWGADCVVTGEAEGNVAFVFTDRPCGIIKGERGDINPMPAWDAHVPKPWQYPGHQHPLALPEAIVMTSRGCPYSCSFCGNLSKSQKRRHRALDDVRHEAAYLWERGVRGIFVYDDEFVDHHDLLYATDAMQALSSFPVRAQGRCNLTRDDTEAVAHLGRLGLKRVMWGIESFSQPVLDAMNKGTTLDGIMTTLEVSHQGGIENFAFLMAGMPGETPEYAADSVRHFEMCLETGLIQKAQVTVCTPMAGTALYEQATAGGWLPQSDPFQYDIGGGTPWLSAGDLATHLWAMRRLAASHGAL